jgi:hypothetical protein
MHNSSTMMEEHCKMWKALIKRTHDEVNEVRRKKGLPNWDFSVGPRKTKSGKFCKFCGSIFNSRGYREASLCDLCKKAA